MEAQKCQKCNNKFFHYKESTLCDECDTKTRKPVYHEN